MTTCRSRSIVATLRSLTLAGVLSLFFCLCSCLLPEQIHVRSVSPDPRREVVIWEKVNVLDSAVRIALIESGISRTIYEEFAAERAMRLVEVVWQPGKNRVLIFMCPDLKLAYDHKAHTLLRDVLEFDAAIRDALARRYRPPQLDLGLIYAGNVIWYACSHSGPGGFNDLVRESRTLPGLPKP